jgi:HicA toxin of bacterial toxin-antitoxin,
MQVNGSLAKRHGSSAPTPLMEAYAHFRLDRQAIPCSKATMLTYEYTLMLHHERRPGRVVVPVHTGTILKPKTLLSILDQAGIDAEQFRRLL